jgi:hypothetical protein
LFPCCQAPAIRFDTQVKDIGCSSIPHVIAQFEELKEDKDAFLVSFLINNVLEKLLTV